MQLPVFPAPTPAPDLAAPQAVHVLGSTFLRLHEGSAGAPSPGPGEHVWTAARTPGSQLSHTLTLSAHPTPAGAGPVKGARAALVLYLPTTGQLGLLADACAKVL
jgi:hypothetical protein